MNKLYITIPMLNEEKLVQQTCQSLTEQEMSDFFVVFVDNGSTDKSVEIVQIYIDENKLGSKWFIVHEPEKGTGSAADTGVREAIRKGATIVARTDSDCLLSKNWTSVIYKAFDGTTTQLISGKLLTREDDVKISKIQSNIINFLPYVARTFGRFRPSNYGNGLKGKYVMVAGCNVAFTSEIYLKSGGFTRSKIEDQHEDRALINRVRKHTEEYEYLPDMIIYSSARRIKKWGIFNTLKWYKDHSYKPKDIDIR